MTQPEGQDDSACLAQAAHPGATDATGIPDASFIAEVVRAEVGEQNFQHWFCRRTRLAVSGDQLLIQVPNPFILNWLLKRFRSHLTRAAHLLLGPSASCHFEVECSLLDSPTGRSAADERKGDPPPDRRSPDAGKSAAAAPGEAVGTAVPLNGSRRRFRTFDSFVSGDCNSLAVMAARQIAGDPGKRFNPLYVHGGTGTGKTHLLEAVYSDVRRRRPQANVMYLSSESFTNYFMSALNARTVPSFRQRFRNVDVLLIDNIEFLDNKRATQEEFLHTVVQVVEHGGHVVVSSDRHPRLLTRHREELTTRFMSGLVCRIESPDASTCAQLVRSLAGGLSATFTDDALDYIARRCRGSVREIQGALNSLDGQYALCARKITLAVAREVLGDLAQECRRLVRISDVEKVVCEAFGVTATDLRSTSRRKALSFPRSVALFLSRRHTKSAYREIGQYFGGRDHSTVVAAERRVAAWIDSGEAIVLPTSCSGKTIAEVVDELEKRLMALAS